MDRPRHALIGRLLLAAAFAVVLGSGLTPVAAPSAAQASTVIGRTPEATYLTWINNARAARGLVPLRLDTRLRDLAEYRAGVMAAKNTMSHTVAGVLSSELTAKGIQWYTEGECIGWDSYSYPTDAVYFLWKVMHDAVHWSILMSSHFNYVGVGIVHRSDNNTTWISIVETESVDHSPPWARLTASARYGSSVAWAWTGADLALQTHTAGLRSFDVQFHVDAGPWATIMWNTTAKYVKVNSRASGHYYGLRVRARDGRGLLSNWSAELRVWVP